MELSAFLGCSVQTYFINDGKRISDGKINKSIKHVESGYYIGMVGARFERENLMDWKYIIITKAQNTELNGYINKVGGIKKDDGKLLCHSMYGDTCLYTYTSIEQNTLDNPVLYIKLGYDKYFNINAYKKRLEYVFTPFFLDANARYDNTSTNKIYCHVVGLGLGVWQIDVKQSEIYIDVLLDTLTHLTQYKNNIPNIEYVDLSWISDTFSENQKIKCSILSAKFNVFLSNNDPASYETIIPDKTNFNMEKHTLVAMYAWDSNAYAGNEYYDGMLRASGDPAAACCSTISFLQNPIINPNILNVHSYEIP